MQDCRAPPVLFGTRPATVNANDALLDPWRLAFDALLSRPENFPLAGALRCCRDNHGPGIRFADNLCAVRLTGGDGRVRVRVLND